MILSVKTNTVNWTAIELLWMPLRVDAEVELPLTKYIVERRLSDGTDKATFSVCSTRANFYLLGFYQKDFIILMSMQRTESAEERLVAQTL